MTNWWPGLIALVLGGVAAVLALARPRKAEVQTPARDEELQRLQLGYESAVASLKELLADRHHYDDAALAAERTRLEQLAAAALAALDARKGALAEAKAQPKRAAAPRPPTFWSKHPTLLGALYGGGTVAFVAVALFQLSGTPSAATPVNKNDPRYEAMLVLSAIAISFGEQEELLQAWELYMRQQEPRRRPPQLQRAIEWLEKVSSGQVP